MRILALSFLGAALSFGAGCGGTVVLENGTGGGSSSSQTGTSSSAHTGSTSTSSTASGGSDCNGGQGCPQGYVCLHADGLCGKGQKGTCQAAEFPPCAVDPRACLCNGTVSSACGTVDISKDPTSCSQGTFPCGPTDCKKYLEYCVAGQPGPAGGGPFAGCVSAPLACTFGIVGCFCVQDGTSTCKDDGQGAVTVFPLTP